MNEYITITNNNKLSALHSQIADLAAQAVTAHAHGLNEQVCRLTACRVTLEIAADRVEMAAEGFTKVEIAAYIARTYGVRL